MKLYAFTPRGHGQYSFYVMAESEEAARLAVDEKIKKLMTEGEDNIRISDYEVQGWGTDYYHLQILDSNEVVFNPND